RKCVHCGFCTATCPTYQLLGDELDGPRGRIYLIKQVVEGAKPTAATMTHLDRCLTCRNCETTCPSGVQYGRLVDVGRHLVEQKVERPAGERLVRGLLREGLTRRWLFDPAMALGQLARPLLPAALKAKVPKYRPGGLLPQGTHERKVLMLNGCVQPAMMPGIDAATMRVLDRLGVQAVIERRSGCCGALRHHLNDQDGALREARRNIDAWWPWIAPPDGRTPLGGPPVEAIVVNASGCGAMVKEYGHLLRNDPAYAERAGRVTELTRDVIEWLAPQRDALARLLGEARQRRAGRGGRQGHGARDDRSDAGQVGPGGQDGRRGRVGPRTADEGVGAVAFHPPCTLQHGQAIRGEVEALLSALGVRLTPVADSHLCCGSAGTYSVLQPELSRQLRDRKLASLTAGAPAEVLTANIGCITHLQSGTGLPVRHWIEWLDEALG
ncbi:MAG TPA: glycolate oxidase subunit GlcF, partial [Burkholderiaceae bacterium]|nr:glycolate oxidase subunit GlcF [Burkholderiaceae bacterium]